MSYMYLNLLEILTLENIYKFKLALFIHKIKNDPTNIPAIFSGTLKLALKSIAIIPDLPLILIFIDQV